MSPQIFKPPCIFGFEPWCPPPYRLELEPREQGGRGYAWKYEVYIRTDNERRPYDLDESYDIYLDGVRVGSAKSSEFVIYVNGKGGHEIQVQKSEGFHVIKSNTSKLTITAETIESLKISVDKTELTPYLDSSGMITMEVYANGKPYPYVLTNPKYTIYVDGYEIMHTNGAKVGWFVNGFNLKNGDKIAKLGKHRVWATVEFANDKLISNVIEYEISEKCSGMRQCCLGRDLYECQNGKWVLKEKNSPACRYMTTAEKQRVKAEFMVV